MKRREAVFVIAQAAVVLAVLGLVALPLQAANESQASTSSTTSPAPTIFTSAVASNGLQLKVVLNATSVRSAGAISGYVTVVNTSNQSVTISPPTQSPNLTYWSDYISICGVTGFMGGYALFQGHFTSENISSAGNPLRLWPSLPASCPGGNNPGTVTFLPGLGGVGKAIDPAHPLDLIRDQLNITSYVCTSTNSSFCSSYSLPGLVGYWSSPTTFVSFSPGQYTIVAWDDWNQYIYIMFRVS